jgi:hypothetical protein
VPTLDVTEIFRVKPVGTILGLALDGAGGLLATGGESKLVEIFDLRQEKSLTNGGAPTTDKETSEHLVAAIAATADRSAKAAREMKKGLSRGASWSTPGVAEKREAARRHLAGKLSPPPVIPPGATSTTQDASSSSTSRVGFESYKVHGRRRAPPLPRESAPAEAGQREPAWQDVAR